MKINRLEIENVKKIKAVQLKPAANGLTVIGGKNNQGKTSVLDAIAWALGGEKYRPSDPQRRDSVLPPNLHIVMDNGLVVERKGKNSTLKVTDPAGGKGGQKLLDEFVEQLAIDLPRFMDSTSREKAQTLLSIIGVGDQLTELELKEKEIYNERTMVGRIADQKEKFAKEQLFYSDVPMEPVSAADLIKEQQAILARNGQRQQWIHDYNDLLRESEILEQKVEEYERVAREGRAKLQELSKKIIAAEKSPRELQMESTEELEKSISNIEEINRKVRANLDKEKAEEDAREYRAQYELLTASLNEVRKSKNDLLLNAELPLPDLGIIDGELTYKGQKWDNMSGSQRLMVSTAIVRKLNPKCGFVLLDKLEQMDIDTLNEFGAWLETEGLQAIATRVSTGDECSIIIEDGMAVEEPGESAAPSFVPKSWEGGF